MRSSEPCQIGDRALDLLEREPPVRDEREVVVEPAPDVRLPGRRGRASQGTRRTRPVAASRSTATAAARATPGSRARPRRGSPCARRAGSSRARCSPCFGSGELREVLLAHPGEPVQAGGARGATPAMRRGGDRALLEQRRACERVRTAARPADGEEALDPKLTEHRLHVAHAVRDACGPGWRSERP